MFPEVRGFGSTLSGVDEKPDKRSPDIYDHRGFLFYSMLTAPGAVLGYKVALLNGAFLCTISTLLCRCSAFNAICCNQFSLYAHCICLFFHFTGFCPSFLWTWHTSAITCVNVKKRRWFFIFSTFSILSALLFYLIYPLRKAVPAVVRKPCWNCFT